MRKLIYVLLAMAVLCSMAFAGHVQNMSPVPSKATIAAKQAALLENQALGTPQNLPSRLDIAPFPEGFEAAVTPNPPPGWVVANVNGDASTWKTTTGTYHSGTKGIYYSYNSAMAADDWLISPATALTGGVSYRVSFWVKVSSSGYPETYELKYGTSQNAAAMLIPIVGPTTVVNTAWAQVYYDFTPAATGSYFIGWHCISAADMWNIYMDDLDLNPSPTVGRCCYGWPVQCVDAINAVDCALLGGDFALGLTCATPCPVPCPYFTMCGPSAEIELNDACPPPEQQLVIACEMTVYGLLCPELDVDYWKVVVPAGSKMFLNQYDGENCVALPTTCIKTDVYYDDCSFAAGPSTYGWILTNPGTADWVIYLKVSGTGTCRTAYKLVTTCCPLVDYCANPLVFPPVYHYELTVNTCCAMDVIPTVCGYGSGPDVIWHLIVDPTVSITASGLGDNQLVVFTDCLDPVASAIACADNGVGGDPETLTNLVLDYGEYYIGVSMYNGACGEITLTIDSDHPLPVELLTAVATPGNGSVKISWTTASELNNASFNILRDGNLVGSVPSVGSASAGSSYTWTDASAVNGTNYSYLLRSVGLDGRATDLSTLSATPSFDAATITEYALLQNYPNPFNPSTSIGFDLVKSGFVSLKVYNLMGQQVATVVNGNMNEGRHIVNFDASNLSSGVYLYRITVNGFSAEKKMLLMK